MSQNNNGARKKISVIELFRFASLTVVFMCHYLGDFEWIDITGQVGVAFFFMISSFLLVKTSKSNGKGLLQKKALQLLPKYEVVLLAVFIVSQIKPSLFHTFDVNYINFLKSFFLIPYKTEGVWVVCPMLPPAWTLVVQAVVFILWYISLRLFKKNDIAAIVLSIVFVVLVILGKVIGYDSVIAFAYCRLYMLYFVAGFVYAVLDNKTDIEVLKKRIYIPGWSCLIVLAFFIVGSYFYKENVISYLIVILSFGIGVLFLKNCEVPKWVEFFGKISYSFYLTHELICKVFTRIISIKSNSMISVCLMLVCFAVATFVAVVYDGCANKCIDGISKAIKKFTSSK